MRQRHRLYRLSLLLLAALVAWTLLGPGNAQALVKALTFTELTQKSKLILTGEVVRMHSYRGPFQGAGEVFYTDVTLRLTRTLKGDAGGEEVTIQMLGGQIGTAWQKCLESPRYKVGEKVLVFLRDYNQANWNTGWLQGKYSLDPSGTWVTGAEDLPITRKMKLADVETSIRSVPAATVEPAASTGGGPR